MTVFNYNISTIIKIIIFYCWEMLMTDKEDQFLSRYADRLLDLGITDMYKLVRHEKVNLIHIIKKQYIYYR